MHSGFLLDDPWAIDSTDFPEAGSSRDKLAFFLNYAVLAPSILATEPWSFHIADESVLMRADSARQLPVTDPEGRELFISCGAALLNLRVAAAAHGHQLNVTVFPDPRGPDIVAEITLRQHAEVSSDDQLCGAITRRRTHRGEFDGPALSESLVNRLVSAARQEGAELSFLTDRLAQRGVLVLAREARREQLAVSAYRSELSRWVEKRIAEAHDHNSEARHRLASETSTMAGGTPEPLDRPDLDAAKTAGVIRMFSAAGGNAEDDMNARASPVLALLTTEADAKENWLAAGQSLERVLLVAAVDGVSASYLNDPIETDRLRPQVARAFNVKGNAQILLRMGRGRQRSPTPRRPMTEVVTMDRFGPA